MGLKIIAQLHKNTAITAQKKELQETGLNLPLSPLNSKQSIVVSGKFQREECYASQCQCVDPNTGLPSSPSTFPGGSHWCDEAGYPRDMTVCKAQSLLVCDGEGSFQPTQCNAQFCFCVYLDTGDVMEDTESIFYPGENWSSFLVRCKV